MFHTLTFTNLTRKFWNDFLNNLSVLASVKIFLEAKTCSFLPIDSQEKKSVMKCLCIETFHQFLIDLCERPLKTGKKAFYHLTISVSVPEI